MIARFLSTLAAIVVGYVGAVMLSGYLPPIQIRADTKTPATLAQVLSNYVLVAQDEDLHILDSPRIANWAFPGQEFVLHDLSDEVPSDGDVYATSGRSVEALYETFLLSLKVDDPLLVGLQNDYKGARQREGSTFISRRERQRRASISDKALQSLVNYYLVMGSGASPAPLALGKAVRDFYGEPRLTASLPAGGSMSFRPVSTNPDLTTLGVTTVIPTVDIAVPLTQADSSRGPAAYFGSVKELRITQLTIQRDWLDQTLLRQTGGPWIGEDPHLFGRGGTFHNLPIRLVLAQKPSIVTNSAPVESATASTPVIRFGPFTYSATEAHSADGKLLLKSDDTQWIVIGVVTRRLGDASEK